MLISNPEFLNPEIYQADDRPRVWRNAIEPFVTWKDAEDALNNPWHHAISVIGDDRKRMDLEHVEEPWFNMDVPRKQELFELVNDGYTVNICKYGHGKPEVDELLSQIETAFDGCADCHIFVTNGANNAPMKPKQVIFIRCSIVDKNLHSPKAPRAALLRALRATS